MKQVERDFEMVQTVADASPWQQYKYKATMISNFDGDTATLLVDLGFGTLHKISVRLARINCPELHKGNDRDGGALAMLALRNFLPPGASVLIQTCKDKTEKFGRYVADLFIPGDPVSVNDQMVLNGFAVYHQY